MVSLCDTVSQLVTCHKKTRLHRARHARVMMLTAVIHDYSKVADSRLGGTRRVVVDMHAILLKRSRYAAQCSKSVHASTGRQALGG
jgi:hypothetical protein